MRKLDATVSVAAFGEGARLTIKTRGGELLFVDLSVEQAKSAHEALSGIVDAPAEPKHADSDEPAPAKRSRAQR